jgi:gliding motility-associated-like protein
MIKKFFLIFLTLNLNSVFSQSFLNGNFEFNSAVFDQINLPNVQFNGFMENTYAFGNYNGGGDFGGNMDIITSDTYCGLAYSCNWFVALTGDETDAISLKLSEPLILGQSYTISFYERTCEGYLNHPFEIGLSTVNNDFGTSVYTAPDTPPTTWTIRTFTFVAPIVGQFITVRTSGGSTSEWSQIDNFFFEETDTDFYLGDDTTICEGGNLILNVPITNATFLWQDNSTDSIYTVDQNGVYWVDVTANGCTYRDSIVINYGQSQIFDLGNDTSICEAGSLILNATIPDTEYLWQDNSTEPILTVTEEGIYWVEVTDVCGTNTDSITITNIDLPILNLGDDILTCSSTSITLNAFTLGATEYLWQNNTTNQTLNVLNDGLYWVEVLVSGCSITDSIYVNYYSTADINLGNDTTLCQGETFNLNAETPSAFYLWQDGSVSSNLSVYDEGIFWVDVDLNDCTIRDTIVISYTPLPIINLGSDTALCETDIIILDATTLNAVYLWQDNSQGAIFEVDKSGEYFVEIKVNNCSNSDTINIDYLPLPKFSFGKDASLCEGDILDLKTGISNVSYIWQDNSTSPVFSVSQAGTYWAEVTSKNCKYTDSIMVDFDNETCNCEVFIPNAFTPNGDGLNDLFKAESNCPLADFFITIYNRWGEIIYTSDAITKGWNGATADYFVSGGVYYYTVTSRVVNQVFSDQKAGTITLLR